jgi:hypothetical protein
MYLNVERVKYLNTNNTPWTSTLRKCANIFKRQNEINHLTCFYPVGMVRKHHYTSLPKTKKVCDECYFPLRACTNQASSTMESTGRTIYASYLYTFEHDAISRKTSLYLKGEINHVL